MTVRQTGSCSRSYWIFQQSPYLCVQCRQVLHLRFQTDSGHPLSLLSDG